MFFAHKEEESSGAKLYVVATPLGNLEDITARAKSVLSSVSWIACEDTRHSAKLLHALDIHTKLYSLHTHNENDEAVLEKFIQKLHSGQSGALISDAGTPLISDPGLPLVRQARAEGITIVPVPGPCAVIVALSAMGLPCDKFSFEGFLPAKSVSRQKRLQYLKQESRTLVFYEAPHRMQEVMTEMTNIFGRSRWVGIGRELTKKFEQIMVGELGDIFDKIMNKSIPLQGEFVVVVAPVPKIRIARPDVSEEGEEEAPIVQPQVVQLDLDRLLGTLLETMPLKLVVQVTKSLTGLPKNVIYERAVQINQKL